MAIDPKGPLDFEAIVRGKIPSGLTKQSTETVHGHGAQCRCRMATARRQRHHLERIFDEVSKL